MTDSATTPAAPTTAAVPTTLSEAMTLIAAEYQAADKPPITSGAALQALAEDRYPDLIGKP